MSPAAGGSVSPVMIPIIGAGIAGVTAALALEQAGLSVRVYEAGAEDLSDDGGLSAVVPVNPAAHAAFRAIGVARHLTRLGFAVRTIRLQDGQAHPVSTVPAAGGSYRCVRRGDMLRLLRSEAHRRGIERVYDTRLTGATVGPTRIHATFSDSSMIDAPLLIGADGYDSTVRASINPKIQPAYTGQWFAHGTASSTDAAPSRPGVLTVMRDTATGHAFGWSTLESGGTAWWLRASAPAPPPHAQADSASQLAGYAPARSPARALLAATPEAIPIYPAYTVPPNQQWVTNTGVLVGDAAHACSPAAGQAVALAAEDAVTLARALRDRSQPVALRLYERMRRARAARAILAGDPRTGVAPGPRYPIDWHERITDELAETVHEQHDQDTAPEQGAR